MTVSLSDPGTRQGAARPLARGWGLAWLLLAILSAGVLFQDGLVALGTAWQLAEYSHGPLIPIISGYLFLRQLRGVPANQGPVRDRWPGLILLALAALLGLAGTFARIGDVVAYALILWVGGIILTSFGWARGRQFWPPVLHLVFMLPLPGVLYWKLSIALQFLSSEIGVAVVRLAGIPVLLDGNVIDLGTYRLQVAEACSGLRYLFPIMSFSYIFAVLWQGPVAAKAVLLLAAAPVTVLMNSLRIGIIGVLVNSYGIEHAEGFLHFFEGWVIFIACVAILFGLSWGMNRMRRNPPHLLDALDLDTRGIGPQFARLTDVRASGAMAGAALAFGILAVGWMLLPERVATIPPREPLAVFPRSLGGWEGRSELLDTAVERGLAADDYFIGTFRTPSAAGEVNLLVVWYRDQTRGGIHSPEVCIPAGGWEMSKIERAEMVLPDGTLLPVNRAVIRKGLERQLVYYWFEQHGGRQTSDWLAKANLLVDGLMIGRTDGALVRAITPILGGESEAEAEARLQSLVFPMMADLPRFVPGR